MSIAQMLLAEFEVQAPITRRFLERLPEGKLTWKPHEKSGTMIWLASHLSNLPEWAVYTIQQDSLDMAPNGVQMAPPPVPKTSKELLEVFDKNRVAARKALVGASDAHLHTPWTLLSNGKAFFTMPKIECLRTWVLNHNVHHRAQLGLYLRLNNIPVPAIYGPSADEQWAS